MAAELERDLGISVRLIRGSRGIFDIKVDGRVVFSKHQLHRFPDAGEAVHLVRGG